MRKEKNIGINALLNVTKQVLSVIFPLITYPYALKVLKPDGIGKVSYALSIVNYFALIAELGIPTYAVREGAKRRKEKEEFNQFANEIFTINVLFTIVAYALLFMTVQAVRQLQEYKLLLYLVSLSIILTTLGVDWINTVYEDFWIITVRRIISQLISLVLLFLLVRDENDYYIYALLTIGSSGLTYITNWVYCRRYANVRLTFHPRLRIHLKPLFVLFATSVATRIYVNFDITMLGAMKGDYYVGLYAVAVKIYNVVKCLLVAIYAVVIPRLASLIGNNRVSEYKKLYSDLWGYLSLLLVPAGLGLICIAPEIMLYMGGDELVDSALTLQILSGALVFAVFGGLVTSCLNVTLGREKENLKATIISAGINCGLNLIFIPRFEHYGAAATTLISEVFVFLFCFVRVPDKHRYLDCAKVKKTLRHSIVGSIGIAVYSAAVHHFLPYGFLSLTLILAGSIFIYGAILALLKNEYFKAALEKIA